jgi:hypothetical protein
MGGEAAPGHQETDGPVTTLSTTFGEWLERVPCIITLVQVRARAILFGNQYILHQIKPK